MQTTLARLPHAGQEVVTVPSSLAPNDGEWHFPMAGGGVVHRFATGPFNWYVIEEAGRLSVVDAGFPGHYAALRRGLAGLGREPRDVEAIVLTHAHADHMGFAERLRRESGAPVFVHAADAHAAQRILQLPWSTLIGNAWHPYVAGMLAHATRNGIFLMPPIGAVQPLADGARLNIPGRPFVLHTPGHTPGEITLVLDGIVLAGDTLLTRNLLRGTHGTPQLASPGLTDDPDAARSSLERLRDLGPATLLCGHGRPWHGTMADAVRMALGR